MINKLAVGNAPHDERNIEVLKQKGIKSVLSLCSEEEISNHKNTNSMFKCERIVLPDHKSIKKLTLNDLLTTLDKLSFLLENGPTFVHCHASIERSPLVCIAWLVQKEKIKPEFALNHLMNVHPLTCPLSDQLNLLKEM